MDRPNYINPNTHSRRGAPPLAPPHTTIIQHATRQVYVIKTRKNYLYYYELDYYTHSASTTNGDGAVAGNEACSFVWGISGGFDAIDLSYGPIGSIPWLGSGGGGKEEGSQNMGGAEAIWGGKNDHFMGAMGTVGSGGQI
jgi:hypothetical protein